jgi:hypothetical protein
MTGQTKIHCNPVFDADGGMLGGLRKGIAMDRSLWLKCNASVGQFRDELAIRGRDYEESEFSMFAPKRFIRYQREPHGSDEVRAQVKIAVLAERDGLFLVSLPAQTFDNGSTITVRADQLEESMSHQERIGAPDDLVQH